MGKNHDNQWQAQAAKAAERIERARARGDQLTFLPDEEPTREEAREQGAPGRPKGAKNKVSSQMRDWLASKGYRMPEETLAEMAGLASSEPAMMQAMGEAEQVLAWAYDGADIPKGATKNPTPRLRIEVFMQLYTIKLRAADALLPYGAPKATPDPGDGVPVVPVLMPYPVAQGDTARQIGAPDPVRDGQIDPWRARLQRQGIIVENQSVADAEIADDPSPRGKNQESAGKSDG